VVVVVDMVVLDVVGLEADLWEPGFEAAFGAAPRPPAGVHAPSTMATSTISSVARRGR
jgi:hypothetical protein